MDFIKAFISNTLDYLGSFFGSVGADTLALAVVCVCAALFISALLSLKLPSSKLKELRRLSPSLMILAGIIGTFWGTFNALSDFQPPGDHVDANAIVDKIPYVLKDMTSAFATSLIGLLSALVFHFVFGVVLKEKSKPLQIEEDTVQLLQGIKDGIVGESDKSLSSQLSLLQAEHRDSIKELRQSISGDSDSSIVTQIVKLRNESGEGFKKLDGLADAIRESIIENLEKPIQKLTTELKQAIIEQLTPQLKKTNELLREQLEQMLKKIEEALIKQFGETFKQFNEATQAIKKWQEDHRQQVEQLTEAFAATAKGIAAIRSDCESIPATMEKLSSLMGEMDERLKAFADMKEQAEQSFPLIKKNLDAVGSHLEKSAAGFSGLEQTITDTYTKASRLAQQHFEGTEEQISKIMDKVQQESDRCVQNTANRLTELAQEQADKINGIMDNVTEKWGEQMVSIAQEMANKIKADR